MRAPAWLRIDAARLGALLCVGGLVLTAFEPLVAAALGLELVAAAFWCWARAAQDRDDQLPRWSWLRRPAGALWLAAGCAAVLAGWPQAALGGRSAAEALRWFQAGALVWAGLELLAALPLERPFSDRPGPLLSVGPWLPVVLPAAGFVTLWRHDARWVEVPAIQQAALFLLTLTALLAALRAFSRQRWSASLRWLVVADSALAAVLVALRAVRPEVSLMLWLAAFGGRAALLAGELRGAAPRRRPALQILWRLTGWVVTAALSWPIVMTLAFGAPGVRSTTYALLIGAAVAIVAWVSVRRLVEAPERRSMVRRESAISVNQIAGLLCLGTAPAALVIAWRTGLPIVWPAAAIALIPALLGGGAAWWLERPLKAFSQPAREVAGDRARRLAHGTFRAVIAAERPLVGLLTGIGRLLLAPSRDLHTGTAQEYLLFLIGLSVLALVLPLLR